MNHPVQVELGLGQASERRGVDTIPALGLGRRDLSKQRLGLTQQARGDRAVELHTQLAELVAATAPQHPRLQLQLSTLGRKDPRQRGVFHRVDGDGLQVCSMRAGSYSNGAYTKSGAVPSDRNLVLASIRFTGVTSRRKRMHDAVSANSRSIATSVGRNSPCTVTPRPPARPT